MGGRCRSCKLPGILFWFQKNVFYFCCCCCWRWFPFGLSLILDEPQLSEKVKGDLSAGCVYEAAERADGRPGGAAAAGSVHGSCGGQQRCSFSFFSLAESSYRSASHQVRIPLKLGCGFFFFFFFWEIGEEFLVRRSGLLAM